MKIDYRELSEVTRRAVQDSLYRSATRPSPFFEYLARNYKPTMPTWRERWSIRLERVRDAIAVLRGRKIAVDD